MIILGRKYKFTNLEKYRLKKQKHKLTVVRYRNRTPKEVIEELKIRIDKSKITTLVINTKIKVDDETVKYLTKLQFEKNIVPEPLVPLMHGSSKLCSDTNDIFNLSVALHFPIFPFNLFTLHL